MAKMKAMEFTDELHLQPVSGRRPCQHVNHSTHTSGANPACSFATSFPLGVSAFEGVAPPLWHSHCLHIVNSIKFGGAL